MLNLTHHPNLPYLILSYANMQHQILPYADSNIYDDEMAKGKKGVWKEWKM